ncbi:MAG: response regulator transcription factor [Peptostreptococcaceae bacterium]|nr:response regulator transcription factor [Peptostreptococcaceae bacterium]
MNILVLDDELELLNIIKLYLIKADFNVFTAFSAQEAIEILYEEDIDLAILDWMMKGLNGIDVLKEALKFKDIKIIMLTAKTDFESEFKALDIGANDYVKKPFDPKVLVLKVKKLLNLDKYIYFRNLKIDKLGRTVYKDEKLLNLRLKELKILIYLLENKNKIVKRQKLLDSVWGYDYDKDPRTLDTHIRRLREKIGEGIIITNRGIGYSIKD